MDPYYGDLPVVTGPGARLPRKGALRQRISIFWISALVSLAIIGKLQAQEEEFKVIEINLSPQKQLSVTYPSNPDSYYVLKRGINPDSIHSPKALALGNPGLGLLTDPSNLTGVISAFYRIDKVLKSEPLDTDGDGINDFYELMHGTFLNPLESNDAGYDFDGDGKSNLREYLDQSNPSDVPRDPENMAPSLSLADTASLAQATSFLYSGPNAIQTGVTESVFDAKRLCVIRGKVATRDGLPLPFVRITVLNHPEFGQTLTRADGMFDLAVNGGGLITVNYERPGYCPIQRQIATPWNDYACLPEAVMITMDPVVTEIVLGPTSPMQVAQGSVQTDEDGSRQARLIFPPGTCANLIVNGEVQPCNSISVRATEFTVGAKGPLSMPAILPPSSAYTYCVELSADEAVAAGASTVQFNQPLCFYVENFLNFPVGQAVPTGFYDREKGVWVASQNGRVIKVLAVTNGFADLDTDGDGNADSPAQLQVLGITEEERQRLGELYSPAQTLWRTCVSHFTPWDCNWPGGPPPNAKPPPKGPPNKKPPDDPCPQGGSIIAAEIQSLGERVDVAGTPFQLNYRSDRVFGNQEAYSINIPLSDETPPEGLTRIILTVEVAGRVFTEDWPPLPNQNTRFTWDGLDAYGRFISRPQPIKVSIGYVYDAVYYAPADFDQAFAAFSDDIVTANSAREEVVLWLYWKGYVGNLLLEPLGPEGWTLDVHHTYDSRSRTIYFGNGEKQSSQAFDLTVISTFAGGGIAPGEGIGDGLAATAAELAVPSGLAVGPDGSVYIAEQNGQRIRKVSPDGIISTIAGSATGGFCFPAGSACGDGGPATDALLNVPHGVAIAPDGTLYIADRGSSRIRRVGPDGIITTIAGTGLYGFSGDGGPSNLAQISGPYGVAIGPDGSLYIADTGNNRVRRVSVDGLITTVAGGGLVPGPGIGDDGPAIRAELSQPWRVAFDPDGNMYIVNRGNLTIRRVGGMDGIISTVVGAGFPSGFEGDGGPAILARFGQPEDIAIAPDGGIYIADRSNARVRLVGPEGIITTFAGSNTYGFSGDGGPATQAKLSEPIGLALGPDGSLYEADWFNQRVRKISSALPGFLVEDILIPAEDGNEVYVFNNGGKHLRTLDALTKAVRYEFTYDGLNHLTGIIDGDGNITTIERNESGDPTTIISPYGQRTELIVNGVGDVTSIKNPANETTAFGYADGALLTSMTDPRNNTWTFDYDNLGRLIRDTDPAGGFKQLSLTESGNDYTVAISTAMDRINSFAVINPSAGGRKRIYTYPTGLQAEYEEGTDGSRTTRFPDGSQAISILGPDPRWGMLAPVERTNTTTTPGGLSYVVSNGRTLSLNDSKDIFSIKTWTETREVNSRKYVSAFDSATKTLTNTTPGGRKRIITYDELMRPVREEIVGLQPAFFIYDDQGRLSSYVEGSGELARTNTFTYNAEGYLSEVTDPMNRTNTYTYDSAGRIITQTFPDNRAIDISYDANGNPTGLTPATSPAHTFEYSPVNLESLYAPPSVVEGMNSTTYSYNLDRELTQVTRPYGGILQYDFSGDDCNCGRLASINQPLGTTTFTYDSQTGNLTTLSAPDGTVLTRTYDGPLPLSEAWSGTVNGSMEVVYNNDFLPVTQLVNGEDAVTFQYNSDSLLTQAGDLQLTLNSQTGLLLGGMLGVTTDNWSYNGFAEPTNHKAIVNGDTIYDVQYTRDALGRITAQTEDLGGITDTYIYTYDLSGQLTEVKKNATETTSYAYDGNNNRLSATDSSVNLNGVYDAQDRLTQFGATSYSYNANGELMTKAESGQTTSLQYDLLGNLLAATLPDGTQIAYVIDGMNRRVGKKRNGILEQGFLYDGPLNCIAELDDSGEVVNRFVYGIRSDVPEYMIRSGIAYRFITDHLGSVRLVVNTVTGEIVQRLDYDAFGQVLDDTAPGFQPFGFAGGLYDRDTGLVRFGARDYDAETGRWTAKDPIRFAAGQVNLYAYVLNDPINQRDPDGLCPSNKKIKPPPKRDALKEYQKTREEFAGEKSEKAAGDSSNAIKKAWNAASNALSGG